jgi:hypothetical protein
MEQKRLEVIFTNNFSYLRAKCLSLGMKKVIHNYYKISICYPQDME